MKICNSCGGVIGRDCFNPQECAIIAQQQAVEFVPCRNCQQLQAENERLKKLLNSVSAWMSIASIEEGTKTEDLQLRLSKLANKINQALKADQ